MSVRPDGGDYELQDGQVLVVRRPGNKPHAQYRWERRAPGRWQNQSVRAAWEEADPVDYPSCNSDSEYARYHEPSDMIIIGCYGMLRTTFRLSDRPSNEREYVLEQVGGRDE